jgi:hypothetical protein
LDAIFEKLAKENLIKFPPTQQIDPGQSKAAWYKDNEYCKFHRVKGHTTLRCMKLKDYVQDLIDRKEITVGAQTSPNAGLQIYQNAFPPHNNQNPGKAPIQAHNANNHQPNQ